jgi:hypothetical protein
MTACGALIYGFAAKADDITQMPRVDSYRDRDGRTVLIDNEDIHPIEWAMEHHKYGQYVFVEDDQLWYSDMVIFGIFLGESGDELDLENMEEVKTRAKDISEAVKFFTDWDTDISDYGYHICTMYDY